MEQKENKQKTQAAEEQVSCRCRLLQGILLVMSQAHGIDTHFQHQVHVFLMMLFCNFNQLFLF